MHSLVMLYTDYKRKELIYGEVRRFSATID